MTRTVIVTPAHGKGALHLCEIDELDFNLDKPIWVRTECGYETLVTIVRGGGLSEILNSPYGCSRCKKLIKQRFTEKGAEYVPRKVAVIRDPGLIEAIDQTKREVKKKDGIVISDDDVIRSWKEVYDRPVDRV